MSPGQFYDNDILIFTIINYLKNYEFYNSCKSCLKMNAVMT